MENIGITWAGLQSGIQKVTHLVGPGPGTSGDGFPINSGARYTPSPPLTSHHALHPSPASTFPVGFPSPFDPSPPGPPVPRAQPPPLQTLSPATLALPRESLGHQAVTGKTTAFRLRCHDYSRRLR